MPEGDSLRIVAARLAPLVGRRVVATSPNPRGRVTGVAAAVDGCILEGVETVGKHLLLRFEGGIVVRNHLRLDGRWSVGSLRPERSGAAGARGGVTAGPWLVLRAGEVEARQWNGPVLEIYRRPLLRHLGPDLLGASFDAALLAGRVRAHGERSLGEVLLDQRVLAGIGNRWMTEALWQARLSPWQPAGEANAVDVGALLAWIRDAMLKSVDSGRPPARIHGRPGRACPRCGEPIRFARLGEHGRSVTWCATCQPSAHQPPADDRPSRRR